MDAPPNIVVILTDDQGAWAMGCAGNAEVQTPNLDRLAAEGIRFENCFCASPVCSPARASIVTGRMPSQHGVHDWIRAGNTIAAYEPDLQGERVAYLAGQRATTDLLAEAGYVCGLSGKWHLGDCHRPQQSYTYWKVHAKGSGPYYRAPMVDGDSVREEERYVTDAITDNALEFLDQQRAGRPFHLGVHFTAPHSPWGRKHHPAATYDAYLEQCPFASLPVEQRHPWSTNGLQPSSERHRRETLAGYFTAITEMDRNVGRLLDHLAASGVLDRTFILFTSDNGMNMGHHGLYGKGNASFPQNMYDTSVKVPAIVRWPKGGTPGRTSAALLSHVDIRPTLLELAGCRDPDAEALPGRSFLPIVEGRAEEVRGDVVVFDEYGPVRMIRTPRWKYVHRTPYGPHELYDLETDPGERCNRVDEPDARETAAALRTRLQRWFERYTDPAVDGRHEPVTGLGQFGLAGLRGDGRINYRQR